MSHNSVLTAVMAVPGPSRLPLWGSVYFCQLEFSHQFSEGDPIIASVQMGKPYFPPACCRTAS